MSKPPGPKEQNLRDQRAARAEKAEAAEKSRKPIPYAGKPPARGKNRKPK